MQYMLINFGIGVLIGAIYLIVYKSRKPKLCDTCNRLIRKGGGSWKYSCRYFFESNVNAHEFNRCPKYCVLYEQRDV